MSIFIEKSRLATERIGQNRYHIFSDHGPVYRFHYVRIVLIFMTCSALYF